MLLCRSDMPIPPDQRRKIAPILQYHAGTRDCGAGRADYYQVPISYSEQGFDETGSGYSASRRRRPT